ncbi:MAG: hypothetical protein KatS3mg124_1752 [Porticoccaceae bacterium]|nr:MAG: hypothetical protein KatS3mg124_1752 [Porticoccaceae bacterium]
MSGISRRRFLRGVLGGTVVTVGLPILNCLLDDSGRAFAATGKRIPVRFGTWIWGCGMIDRLWVPEQEGTDYALPPHLEPIAPYRDRIAVLSGFDVVLDGVPNKPHVTGCLGLRTGIPTPDLEVKAPTLDVLVADVIADTRFRSIEVCSAGIERSYSYRDAGSPNPSETSPLALYRRIFGEGFVDPNAADFQPDPRDLVHKSVLSAVSEERRALLAAVGAEDRHRLDEYFTALRELEQKIALQLEPPAPVENFQKPEPPPETPVDAEIEHVLENHRLMAQLLARALQANQTRVFNVLFSDTASNLRKPGTSSTHHTLTHEEPVDPELGYQREVAWFAARSMEAWRDFLDALAAIPEGDGTLLDHCLVFAHSDCSDAKAHAVEGIPMMVAGSAGGRIRTRLPPQGPGRRHLPGGAHPDAGHGGEHRSLGYAVHGDQPPPRRAARLKRPCRVPWRRPEGGWMRILLVEDDPQLGDTVRRALAAEGYAVDWLADGAGLEAALACEAVDLLVLDVRLPGRSGIDLLRALRSGGPRIAGAVAHRLRRHRGQGARARRRRRRLPHQTLRDG